jgi:hypothetical protein
MIYTIYDVRNVKNLDSPGKQGGLFKTDGRNGSFICTDCVAWTNFGMIPTQKNRSNRIKTHFTTTTSIKYPTWKEPGSKPNFLFSLDQFYITTLILQNLSFSLHFSHYTFYFVILFSISFPHSFLVLHQQKCTALLVGRSRDRFPLVSVTGDFFRSYRRNHVPWGRLSF